MRSRLKNLERRAAGRMVEIPKGEKGGMTYREENGWKLLRVRVPRGPLNNYPGRSWCHHFEHVLRETRRLAAAVALGEVGGEGGYNVRESPEAAYEVLRANRGGEVLFGAGGPASGAALSRVEEVFDADSSFWRAERRERRRRSSRNWERWRLPRARRPREGWKGVYLRFGDLPPEGRSRCQITGAGEEGVSVFRAYEVGGGSYLVDLEENTVLAAHFLGFERSGRPVFVVAGEEVGTGQAGEPLLANISSYGPVPPDSTVGTAGELHSRFRASVRKELAELGVPSCRLPARLPPSERHDGREVVYSRGGDFEELRAAVLPHATRTSQRSRLHGPGHWRRVARNGQLLCEGTPGADPHVVALFAALHDAARDSDGRDPPHGRYAARVAERLYGEAVFAATDEQMDLLVEACARHVGFEVSDDPTIGVCFDADRLDLTHRGVRVDPKYLSTEAAKEMLG
ncbi:MAG: hypothetical protein M3N18_02830 [Actinomycetota bacterium]|nr:hypothetical protein [Actinomycetota bacterium]